MNFNNVDMLDIVEEYASMNNLIDSEEMLSLRFDQLLEEIDIDTDDSDMIHQAFNDWSDGLCKDGEIHQEQYNNYTYVGKYS